MQCMAVFRLLFAHVACAKPEAYYRLVLASQTQYCKQLPEAPYQANRSDLAIQTPTVLTVHLSPSSAVLLRHVQLSLQIR